MTGVSRRSIVAGGTALLGGLLAPPILRARADSPVSLPLIGSTTHFSASHWGGFYADVEANQIARIRPFGGDSLPSPQLAALAQRPYTPDRIKSPMVRAGFLREGAGAPGAGRGTEPFVRVSWDRALDLVANEVKRVNKAFGGEGIYAGSYGWKSPGSVNTTTVLLHRLFKLNGGYVDLIGDYSTGASQVIMPYVVGSIAVYEQQTAWPQVLEHTDTVVLWGADPLTTNQIDWGCPGHYAYDAFKEMKDAGRIHVIGINPVRVDSIEYLGAEWIAPRPNTDVALMLGVAYVLHEKKLHDQAFLKKYTVGFEEFERYLLGKADGVAKTPQWAAAITGLSPDAIEGLAVRLAHGRTMLMSGWGIQRQDHGEQVHWMLVTLAAMLGQIGLPGGGFGLSYHYGNGGSPTAKAPILKSISGAPGARAKGSRPTPAWLQHASAAVPVARFSDLFLNPGKTIDFNGKRITYPDIRLVYWTGGNPFSHQEQVNRLIEAWRRPETVIVQDSFWTATAKMADIVLPATTTLERDDITQGGAYSNRFLFAMQKVIDPLFESRNDYDIFADLADRLGFRKEFTEGRSAMDWIKTFYADMVHEADAMHVRMPDFDEFWRKGYVAFDVPDEAKTHVTYSDFRADPIGNALGTESGRIEIFSKQIASYKYDDCPPHPTWLEPAEWLGSPKAKDFPLHLLSPHPKNRLHSQLDNTWLRDKYEVAGREPVWIHPKDAKPRNIRSGDVVKLFNDRGVVLAGAIVTERVMPGVVRMQEGGWYDPLTRGEAGSLGKHGHVNVVTLDKGSSRLAQANIANTTLVDVARYDETPPEVTAFDPPAIRQ
jgi:trimethylamine-N-oxide reductase (cytochrome c)